MLPMLMSIRYLSINRLLAACNDCAWGAIQGDAAYTGDSRINRGWAMAAAKLSDEAFLAILEAHPGLRDRFASIALAVVNSEGNLREADVVEERLVGEW